MRAARIPGALTDIEPAAGPLRVLAVVHRYLPGRASGAEVMLHRLLTDSARRGHRVRVATRVPSRYVHDGIEVVPRASLNRAGWDADVIIGHLTWGRDLARVARPGAPLVYLAHNESELRSWRHQPGAVTAVVWNAEHMAAGGRDVWAGPSAVVRPPVLLDDYRVDRDPWGAPFTTLVNAVPEKGVRVLYDLAERHPDRRFLAVEGGYGTQQKPRGLPNVEWQPATGDMPGDVYARTRVLLMLSHRESWGRVGCEAMCSGVPVIAHPAVGLRESLGDAAWWVDRSDRAAVSAALTALDDEQVYREWQGKSSARAVDLDRMGRSDLGVWDDVLRQAAAAGARPRRQRPPLQTPVFANLGGMNHDPFAAHRNTARRRFAHPRQRRSTAQQVPDDPAEMIAWMLEGEGREEQVQRAALVSQAERAAGTRREDVLSAADRIINQTDNPDPDPAPGAAAGPVPVPAGDVPGKAREIVAWIRDADTPTEAAARADAARRAETDRHGQPRPSVAAEIDKTL